MGCRCFYQQATETLIKTGLRFPKDTQFFLVPEHFQLPLPISLPLPLASSRLARSGHFRQTESSTECPLLSGFRHQVRCSSLSLPEPTFVHLPLSPSVGPRRDLHAPASWGLAHARCSGSTREST